MANRSPYSADIDAALEHLTAATMLLHASTGADAPADAYHEAREKLKEACRHLEIHLLDDIVKEQQRIKEMQAAAQLMNGDPYKNHQLDAARYALSAGMTSSEKTATEMAMRQQAQEDQLNRLWRTMLDGMQVMKPKNIFDPKV